MPDSPPDRAASDPITAPPSPVPPRPGSRLKVGVPAVIALVAVGSVPLVFDGGGDERVRSVEAVTTTSSPPGTVDSPDPIFTSVGATSEDASDVTTVTSTTIPSTTDAVSTTTASTTTSSTSSSTSSTATTATVAVAETLPAQPSAPIAPPADPRGFEEQVQLGGISIPKLGVDAPLLQGIRLTTLDQGPGHWPGTALPGEVGNVVVAAHRTSHGGPFRNIDQLVEGDVVLFDTGDGEIEYTVTGTQIVNPDAIWIVDPTETATATLFACHPPGSVAQRIVVKLELAA